MPTTALAVITLSFGLLFACSKEPSKQEATKQLLHEAEQTAQKIAAKDWRQWRATTAIARTHAKLHQDAAARADFAKAKEAVRKYSSPDVADFACAEFMLIAAAEASVGYDDDAAATRAEGLQRVQAIPDAKRRAGVLIELAKQMADSGAKTTAMTLVDAGVKEAKTLPNKWTQSWLFRVAAGVYQKIGAHDAMRRTITLAEPGAWLEGDADQPIALTRLSETYALLGNRDAALAIAKVLPENYQPPIQAALAQGQAARGELDAADAAARQITYPLSRSNALRGIALYQLRAGAGAKAREEAQAAWAAARKIGDDTEKVVETYAVAAVLLRVGDAADAKKALSEAMTVNRKNGASWNMDDFIAVLRTLAKSGDVAGAEELARMIKDPATKTQALSKIGVERARVEARQNGFESGRDAARRIEDPFYRTQALLAAIEGLAAR